MHVSGEAPFIEPGRQLTGNGGGGVFHAGMLAKHLAFDPVGIKERLAHLGQAHVVEQQLLIGGGSGVAGATDGGGHWAGGCPCGWAPWPDGLEAWS